MYMYVYMYMYMYMCNASRGLLRALREGRQTVATPEVVAHEHVLHPQGFAQDRSALHSAEGSEKLLGSGARVINLVSS